MSSSMVPHALYVVYTVAFLLFTGLLGISTYSEMYQASVQRLVEMPWQQRPRKTLMDVTGGPQVYSWISNVFLEEVYRDMPLEIQNQAYCTEFTSCSLGDGTTNQASSCADGLVLGEGNCASYLGSGNTCCEPCLGASCKTAQASDSSVNATANLGTDVLRPIMLGTFNRLLMGRLTLKRIKLVPHTAKSFLNAYPQMFSTSSLDPYSQSQNNENMDTFGPSSAPYEYDADAGFNGAGGFVQYLDFSNSPKEQIIAKLAQLNRDWWFDLNQGSFVLDMMLYNGNVDKFLYVAFVFQHDFTGKTTVTVNTSPLDLTLHQLDRFVSFVRFFLFGVILICFCYFAKVEFEELSSTTFAYFTDVVNLMQILSLGISLFCFIDYLVITVSWSYLRLAFPIATDTNIQQYEDLSSLAQRFEILMTVVSINTCIILVRCLCIMTYMIPQLGIVHNSFAQVKWSLLAFCTMFAVMVWGFCVCSYMILGTRREEYSTVVMSLVSTFRMIMREPTLLSWKDGDADLCASYFIAFHVFFLIVQQLLLSIGIKGFMLEQQRLNALQDSEKHPLKRFWGQASAWIREYSTWINRCLVSLQTALVGTGSSAARVNYSVVAKMRDGRATKPRMRYVTYDKKEDEDDTTEASREALVERLVCKDFKLSAEMPFYPGGMMHYWVEEVTENGTAKDANVLPRFRLVGIQSGGEKVNDFREVKKFEEKGRDTQRLLQDSIKRLPVTLIFEGHAKPFSWECAGLVCFTACFLWFAVEVSRVDNSYSQMVVHNNAFVQPVWYAGSCRNLSSFDSLGTMGEVSGWLTASLLDQEYACSTDVGDESSPELCVAEGQNAGVRSGWFLWRGPAPEDPPKEVVDMDARVIADPNFVPFAAQSLSMGFIPLAQPIGTEASIPVTQAIHLNAENVGVMPNNHVRLTFQVACYQANRNARFAPSYRLLLDPAVPGSGCADHTCMQEQIHKSSTCLNSQGEVQDLDSITGEWSGLTYNYAVKGTYHELGGYAVGFGNTRLEANIIAEMLEKDQILKRFAISAAVEVVSYNGNYDMFMYAAVTFNTRPTGLLEKQVKTAVYPVNIFSMGSGGSAADRERVFNWFLLFGYILAALVFTVHLIWDLFKQYSITKAMLRPPYKFLYDFFMDEWWNVVDVVSVALNIAVINNLFSYMLINSQVKVGVGILSWTNQYQVNTTVDLNTADPVQQFAMAADIYSRFVGLAAVNGLFLLVRYVKYLGGLASLRLVLNTLAAALNDMLIVLAIFCTCLLGYVYFFFTRFGVQFSSYGTMDSAFVNLFMFTLGRFQLDGLMQNSPAFFFMAFPIFMILFFLILNMLLAAIVFRWRDMRRDAQEFSIQSTWRALRESVPFNAKAKDKEEEKDLRKLDGEFWQKLSVLRYVQHIDETGKISVLRSTVDRRKRVQNEDLEPEDTEDDPQREDANIVGGFHLHAVGSEQHQKFLKAFRKGYMELASQLSRSLDGGGKRRDSGGGVNFEPEADEVAGAVVCQREETAPFIGIIEEPQTEEREQTIVRELEKRLEEADQTCEEIWLDMLVTVLEENRALEAIQRVFLPPPMLAPSKPQEWRTFNLKKVRMEGRLNLFLQWLHEEARLRHYKYLEDVSSKKEQALKQQSLVLTDYLEQIDTQIEKLQDEIKVLERKSAHFRSPIAPLMA